MQEFDCLDSDLDVSGEIFLEASAGTGKTFAIEHVVSRLILLGIPIDKILITTFTKAGVRDLKMRIYENLLKSLKNPPPYLKKEELLLSLRNAASLIDEASIYTIHSFCYRMLSEFAFEAKIDMELKSPDDASFDSLKRAALDALRTTFDETSFSLSQLSALMKPFGRDLSAYVKKMTALLKNDPIFEDLPTYADYKKKFDNLLDPLDKEALKNELLTLLPLYKGTTSRSKEIHPHLTDQIEALCTSDLELLLKASPSFFSFLDQDNEKKGGVEYQKFPHFEKLQILGNLILEASDPKLLFLRIAKKVSEIAKKEETEISPSFLLQLMKQSLSLPAFKAKVESKYEAVIIDEFQDTDPLQWEIFHSLYFKKTKLFLVVGDPKQSIYAFRGADLSTFLKAKKAFTKVYSLKTNYRSGENLLSLLNSMFDEKKAPSLFTFDDDTLSLSYESVSAGKKVESTLDKSSALFVFAEEEESRLPSQKLEKEVLFPYIAKEIIRLKEQFHYTYDAFAILVKDRFQAKRLHLFLENVGLPAEATSSESIALGGMFLLLEIVFSLLKNPRDLNFIKQFLINPLIGAHLHDLTADFDSPLLAKTAANFIRLKNLYETKGLAPFFDAFAKTPFYRLPFLESIVKDKEAYSDYIQMTTILLSRGKEPILEFFKEMRFLEVDENPHLRRVFLLEESAIHIMTSHMSKGLEFEIVFALGTSSRHDAKPDYIKKQDGSYTLYSTNSKECQKTLFATDQEKLRLLYVAATRAKTKLYLMAPLLKTPKQAPWATASPIELFLTRLGREKMGYKETYEALSNLSIESVLEKCQELHLPYEKIGKDVIDLSQTEILPPQIAPAHSLEIVSHPKRFTSFSNLAKEEKPFEIITPSENALPLGSETGNIIHLIFEKIIEEGIYFPWNEELIYSLIKKETLSTHLKNREAEIYDLIKTAFHTQLDGFALKDVDPSYMLQEMSFFYESEIPKTFMKGFIDLVFCHKGLYYIVDWKMNYLMSYTPISLDEAMQTNNYYLQASLYAEALKKHLGEDFDNQFGGTFYFFLRGKENGLISFFPKEVSV